MSKEEEDFPLMEAVERAEALEEVDADRAIAAYLAVMDDGASWAAPPLARRLSAAPRSACHPRRLWHVPILVS